MQTTCYWFRLQSEVSLSLLVPVEAGEVAHRDLTVILSRDPHEENNKRSGFSGRSAPLERLPTMIEELLSAARQGDGDAIRNLLVTTVGRPDCRPSLPRHAASPIQISRPRLSRPDRHHLGASLLQDRANELINLAKDRMTGAGPLHLAAESGSVEAIEALSRLGWRATARDAELATALHYAAARGHAAAVASLCALGADVAARDERDCVPLHYSAGGGKWDAARALLVRGADPNAPDKDERTPLHYAARRGCPKTTGLLVNGWVGDATRRDERARHDGAERGGGTQAGGGG